MQRHRISRAVVSRTIAFLLLTLAAPLATFPSAADDRPEGSAFSLQRGFDYYEIREEKMRLRFRKAFAIPKDFFGEGSKKWKGDIDLCGDPLGPFMGRDIGNTSLIVERKEDAVVPVNGTVTLPICVAAIKVKGVTPIVVDYGDGSQKTFEVTGGLSEVEWPGSTETIRMNGGMPGTMDICAYVPLIIYFREVVEGDIYTYDFGQLVPPEQRDKFLVKVREVLWQRYCFDFAAAFHLPAEGVWPLMGPDGPLGGDLKSKNLRLPVRPARPVRPDGTGTYVFNATALIDFQIFTVPGVRTLPSSVEMPFVLEVSKAPDTPDDEFAIKVRQAYFTQQQGVLGPMNLFFGDPWNCPAVGSVTGARFENGRLKCGTGKLRFFPKLEIENNFVVATTDTELCLEGFFFFDGTIINAARLDVPCQDLSDERGGLAVMEVGTGQRIGTLHRFALGTNNDVLNAPCPDTITCNEPVDPQ